MLDAFIIHEIRRREHERAQRERQRPQLEIPLHSDEEQVEEERAVDPSKRPGGVVQIDL